MENMIRYADEEVTQARTIEDRRAVMAAAMAAYPVYLGMVQAVTYDAKTDRYVAKCHEGSSARLTSAVAEFLLIHVNDPGRRMKPMVYAHMADGAVDAVSLLYLSRRD